MLSTRNNNLHLFLIVTVYALAFSQFAFITADPDLWGHIKFGQEIWAQKSFPQSNYYSYTVPDYPWINHEWLAEIILYGIYSFFGSTGLLVFKCLIGQYVVHLIYMYNLKNKANPWVLTVSMLLVIPVLAPGFMVRPHLWTLLFFTIFILLLHEGLERNNKALYWIPLLMLIWVNCHGGVVAGLGIFMAVTFTEGTRAIISSDKIWKPLLASFLCSCLAVLINPYGISLWDFFYHSLSQPRNISEWNPVPLWGTQFLFLKILVTLFLVTLFIPEKKQLWKLIVIAASIFYGFKHQRHTVLTAIVLAFYLPIYLSKGLEIWKKHFPTLFKAASSIYPAKILLSLFIVLQLFDGYSKYDKNKLEILVEPQVYPSYLAQFMRVNQLRGNILVPFDWGEYFIWKLPSSRVSLDGRFRTAYPEEIINWNQKVYSSQNPESTLLNKYPTEFIVVQKKSSPANYLMKNNDWIKIYEDLMAMLFIRTNQVSTVTKFTDGKLTQPTEPPSFSFP